MNLRRRGDSGSSSEGAQHDNRQGQTLRAGELAEPQGHEPRKPALDLIDLLRQKLAGDSRSRREAPRLRLLDLIFSLGRPGPGAQLAIPLLQRCLGDNDQWVRIYAARALWDIGSAEAPVILPLLIEELQCHPVGLLAADLLGKMGYLARPAIPELRRIIDSGQRLVQLGAIDEWVDLDEAFRAAAVRALTLIEAAGSIMG